MNDIIKIDVNNIVALLSEGKTIDLGKPFARQIYLVDAHVAGTGYIDNIDELESMIHIGQRLRFFREPANPYDELAIVIKDENGNKLGYVPRSKNEILARLMDAGKLIYGTVHSKQYENDWLHIEIQVFMDD